MGKTVVSGGSPSPGSAGSSQGTDSSSSTLSGKLDPSSISLEESSKTNKKRQSSPSPSSASALLASLSNNNNTTTSPNISNGNGCVGGGSSLSSTNFLSAPSTGLLGGTNNFNTLLSDGSQNKLGKSNKSTSTGTQASSSSSTPSSAVAGLFTGLGAKIPIISSSATAALEKHLKNLTIGGGESGSVVVGPTAEVNNLADEYESSGTLGKNNNNNTTKRNSRNMENINFLGAGLPPIPPTPGNSTASHSGTSTNLKELLIPLSTSTAQPIKPVRVSLPTKSSKQGARLKSPSRRKSNVSSPPPTLDDMAVGGGSCASSYQHHHHHHHHHGPGSTSGKSGKKKLSSGKRYASSLPDRERCSATSPVAFDLNSFLCHSQGPIDFSSLLSRVHAQQQLLQQHSVHPQQPPHMIHHPIPTLMGHPRPTKHCKNKHMWARASLEREIFTGAPVPSPTPTMTSGGNNMCNNLSGNSGAFANVDKQQVTSSSPCGSKLAGGMVPPQSNRHSSYHPNYGLGPGSNIVGDSAAAAAAAAAAAYNAHLMFSRPTSPMFIPDSGSCCSEYGAAAAYCCPGCAAKTFPRVAARASGHGLCFCCHQNGGRSNVHSPSRAPSTTPNGIDNVVGGVMNGSQNILTFSFKFIANV